MVRFTIDTEKESTASIRKLISFLEHAVAERSAGEPFVTNDPYASSQISRSSQHSYSSQTSQPEQSATQTSSGIFDIFKDERQIPPSQPSSPSLPSQPFHSSQQPRDSQDTTQTPTHTDDLFSMFSSNQPSSSLQTPETSFQESSMPSSEPNEQQESSLTAQDLLCTAGDTDDSDEMANPRNVDEYGENDKKKETDFFRLQSY